jgi:hypothetical protein
MADPKLEEVFKTSGIPTFTFVKPAEYERVIVALRTPGRGLVVEGPSGIGKTTSVSKALQELALVDNTLMLSARKKEDRAFIAELPTMKQIGNVLIDDFHRLDDAVKQTVADYLKTLADEKTPDNKLIVVGINKAGDSLVHFAADLNLPAEDILGKPRIQNAKGLSSSIIDMGVYEYPGVPIPPPPADFTLKINPSILKLETGQDGTVMVTLTPTSSFQGAVSLTCGSLPATVSCSFQPQQVDLSSGVAQTAQLVIGTHKVIPSGFITSGLTKSSRSTAMTLSSLLACFVSIFLFVPGRGANRRLRQFLIIILTAAILSGLSACGITFNGFPGSYSIAVYAKGSTQPTTHQASLGLNLLP